MCAKHRRDRKPIVSKLPTPSRHRSPTLSQTVRGCRCSPITVSRWSKICPIDRRRHDVGASVGEAGYPRSANCPRRRAIALSHSRRLCAPASAAPITVSRWSKIGPIDRPRQHVCKHRCERIPKVGKLPAHAVPSRPTGVRRSGSPHLGFTLPPRVGRRCTRAMPHKAFDKPNPRSANCLRRRTSPLRHSPRLCAAAGTLPPPFLDGRKSIASTTCATFA